MAVNIARFLRLGGLTCQMFFTSSRLKLSFFLLRSITSSVSDRLTNFPETFFLPVFLSTSIFSPGLQLAQNIPGLVWSAGLLRHYAGRGKDQDPAQTEWRRFSYSTS